MSASVLPVEPEISRFTMPLTVIVPDALNFRVTVSTEPASAVNVPPETAMSRADAPLFSVSVPRSPTVPPVTDAPAATSTAPDRISGSAASQPVTITRPFSATASVAAAKSANAS